MTVDLPVYKAKENPTPAYLPTKGSILDIDTEFYDSIANTKARKLIHKEICPIRAGRAWKVKKGSIVRITTPEGPQVCDFNVWQADNYRERLWAARTRQLQSTHVKKYDRLWSNLPYLRPLLTVTGDSIRDRMKIDRIHDLLGTRCDPYVDKILSGEDNDYHCHSNLYRAIIPYGGQEFDVHDVLNIFQVTGLNENGQYFMETCPAVPGDYFEFFAETDLLCAISACPGGDLSAWDWGEGDEETKVDMVDCCRPLGIEVYEITDDKILQMGDDLEYIISSYSSLKLNVPPLGDVDLNRISTDSPSSPSSSLSPSPNSGLYTFQKLNDQPQDSDTEKLCFTNVRDNPTEIYQLCIKAITLGMRKIKSLKSINSPYLKLMLSSFSQVYKLEPKQENQEVQKLHQNFIVKLIELESKLMTDYQLSFSQIKLSFLHSHIKEFDIIEVLMTIDPSSMTLKFFILQIIYKQFQSKNYAYAPQLLEFFLSDAIPLSEQLSEQQKRSLVKLVLSISRISPFVQYKECMRIKFIIYLVQFGFEFNEYISNKKKENFIQEIRNSIRGFDDYGKIPYFIFRLELIDDNHYFVDLIQELQIVTNNDYSSINWSTIDAGSLHSKKLLKLLNMPNINAALIKNEMKVSGKLSSTLSESLCDYIGSVLSLSSPPTEDLQEIILLFLSQVNQLSKSIILLFDKFVLNWSKFLNEPEFLESSLLSIHEIAIKSSQFKRSKNISNLFYNYALKIKNSKFKLKFMVHSVRIERDIFCTKKMPELSDLSLKFKKCYKFLVAEKLDTKDMLGIIYNDMFLNYLDHVKIVERLMKVDSYFVTRHMFGSISNFNIDEFSEENRVIIFILLSKYTIFPERLSNIFNKLQIYEPVLQMLCGIYYSNIPIVRSMQKSSLKQITQADFLIKIFYYLTCEIKTKSIGNISKILQMYIAGWISKNKRPVSSFEMEFLKRILGYLKFINFQKSLRKLLTELEKYKEFNVNNQFDEWLIHNRIENHLELKIIDNSLNLMLQTRIEQLDFESTTDYFLRNLSFELLKLRYYLVGYEQDQLSQVSLKVSEIINSHRDSFSKDNKYGYNKEKFLEIMTLLLNLHFYRGKCVSLYGNHIESISSYLSCIKLGKSILKSNNSNLEILGLVSSSFINLIKLLIHLGTSKDSDYFVDEFFKFNEAIAKFNILHVQNLYFLCFYYNIVGRKDLCLESKARADSLFQSLNIQDGNTSVDNHRLMFHKLLSDVYCEEIEDSRNSAKHKVSKFITECEKEFRITAKLWKIYYECHYDVGSIDFSFNYSESPYLKAVNHMLNSKKLFFDAQGTLSSDPLFSTLEDSALSIPSAKDKDPVGSPRPSSSKARNTKNVNNSIMKLKQSRDIIISLFPNLKYLANYQLNDIHKILSLDLLTLSSISNSYHRKYLDDCCNLNDYLKHQPMINERIMIDTVSLVSSTEMVPSFDFNILQYPNRIGESVNSDVLSKLPDSWLVITIDICSFNGDLIISKISKATDGPKVLRLPLNRHSSRTIDEESFSFENAKGELRNIIAESDKTLTKERTSRTVTAEDRKAWHEERSGLDERLQNFLDKIEYYWLGGFKGIFNQIILTRDEIGDFKSKFLNIIKQNIPSRSQKNQQTTNKIVEIDDFVVELFLRLGDPSNFTTTELLEDLIYFLLDILLFHGEENAYDEIDIDNIYVQVEMLLKDISLSNPNPVRSKHTVLIVGKECQSFPWESLPCLRQTSTTRMPSLTMLVELLERNKKMAINKKNGSFILNPSGDLVRTQERLMPVMNGLVSKLNWKGITNRKPTEDEFKECLTCSNIHIYVGHGGGEAFIRSNTLKKLDNTAPTLLLGCSSASLKDNNLLEPYGTIYSYLIGGCPMVLGNLWDVTDKDIDKFSLSVFDHWGLTEGIDSDPVDICEAVKKARSECKLKYLNGAAPVIYGLPLSLL
ncbi:hypothetical protein WICMUC_000915 [Wickerhamomyces mucosus]|uniref:separase n=1 Tax=Wickerhamomyces mucosus TaxID=1378264 RepID=A0A9P8PWR3_9ASCO|nr:hypothetical protein WICMUC_000915 [Wickerhamomyces mucosus]